jgi:hypothetical protein
LLILFTVSFMQEPEVKVFDSLNLSGGVDMCEMEQWVLQLRSGI